MNEELSSEIKYQQLPLDNLEEKPKQKPIKIEVISPTSNNKDNDSLPSSTTEQIKISHENNGQDKNSYNRLRKIAKEIGFNNPRTLPKKYGVYTLPYGSENNEKYFFPKDLPIFTSKKIAITRGVLSLECIYIDPDNHSIVKGYIPYAKDRNGKDGHFLNI